MIVYASRGGLRGLCRVEEVVAEVIGEAFVLRRVETKSSELHKILGGVEGREDYVENRTESLRYR